MAAAGVHVSVIASMVGRRTAGACCSAATGTSSRTSRRRRRRSSDSSCATGSQRGCRRPAAKGGSSRETAQPSDGRCRARTSDLLLVRGARGVPLSSAECPFRGSERLPRTRREARGPEGIRRPVPHPVPRRRGSSRSAPPGGHASVPRAPLGRRRGHRRSASRSGWSARVAARSRRRSAPRR